MKLIHYQGAHAEQIAVPSLLTKDVSIRTRTPIVRLSLSMMPDKVLKRLFSAILQQEWIIIWVGTSGHGRTKFASPEAIHLSSIPQPSFHNSPFPSPKGFQIYERGLVGRQ